MKNRFSSHRHFGYAQDKFGRVLNALVHLRAAWTLTTLFLLFYSAGALAQPFAYVPNASSNNVTVINTASNTVIATVPVGSVPVGVAITPDGSFAYVTKFALNNVSVINTSSNTVVATVPVGGGATGVAITPDGSLAYVTNFGSNNVSVINTASNAVIATVPVGSEPHGIAITPDGNFAYVTTGPSNVWVININTNAVIANVPVGNRPEGITITPDGSFAYVANRFSDNVSVIDIASNTVVVTVTVEDSPREIAFTPNGNFAYVANRNSNNVTVINTASNTVVATVPVGIEPQGIAITPDGNFAYVANVASNDVSVINISTNTVVATVPAGDQPVDIAITPAPEIDVQYKGVSIANGDDTPSTAEGTDFGSAVAAPGNFVARTFTIANTGSAALNLTGALPRVQVSGPNASEFTVLVPPASSVSAGSTTTFTVHFHPKAPGLRTATFSIANDDSDENPYQFAIQGTGVVSVQPFVFLANKVTLKSTKQSTPAGDIHSNGALTVEKGDPSTYNSNLTAAGKITINKHNTINGNVTSQTAISNSGTINGTKTIGPVDYEPLPSLDYGAGGPNKSVPSGGSLTLAPGSYGIVTLNENSTIKLTSGEYFMNELRYSSTIKNGVIEIDLSSGNPVTVNIVSNFQFGHSGAIRLLPNGESDSKLVTFNTLQSTSAYWGREAYLLGSFNAPNAIITLVKNTQLRGSICAKEIIVSNDCLFLHHDSPGSLPGPGNLPKSSFEEETASDQSPVTSYQLEQNYPNPFNPTTTISFALPQASEVTLSIFNANGQLVKKLVAGALNAGRHRFTWDATNDHGDRVASGVYLYVIKAGEFTAHRKLVLMK